MPNNGTVSNPVTDQYPPGMLVKEGVLTQDMENSTLTLDHLEINPM